MIGVSSSMAFNSIRLRLIFALGIGLFSIQAMSEFNIEGNFIQGGFAIGSGAKGLEIWQDDEKLRVTGSGLFLLGFGRDAPKISIIRYKNAKGEIKEQFLKIKKRKYNIQKINGLPPKKVSPTTKEDLKQISTEIQQIKNARSISINQEYFNSGFMWPVKGFISGVYGSQRILNGKPRRPHYGIDIIGEVGTPIVAPADGVVTLVQANNFFSGNTLIIDHGYRLSSAFLHLSQITVKNGQFIKKGQIIGKIGSTGRSTGPHLDWRINLRQHRIDPQLLVPPM